MRQINHYRAGILRSGETYFEIEKLDVAVENDTFIVFNDSYFTKIAKGKDYSSTHPRIEYSKIWKREESGYFKDHKYLGDGIFYELYTEKGKIPSTIQAEIAVFIQDNYGYLSNIDLSFIK